MTHVRSYWDRVKTKPMTVKTIDFPLQSDSGYREDLQAVLKEEWEEAAKYVDESIVLSSCYE